MKTTLLLVAGFFISFIGSGQDTQSNVSTPRGTSIRAYIMAEISQSTRVSLDNSYGTPGRTLLYYFGSGYTSSTRQFNCHGYAWNMAESGPVRWIGRDDNTDEDPYMTDGSYIRVCSETYPGKVSFASDDHSAITTATPGRWISKWGTAPYLEHNWNDTPYNSSDLRYYVATTLSGPATNVCSANTDITYSVPAGANYLWSYSSTLQQISGSTNQSTFTVRGNNTGSDAWVQVNITSPCDGRTITNRRDILLGPPTFNNFLVNNQPSSGATVCTGSNTYIQALSPGPNSYTWALAYGNPNNAYLTSQNNTATFLTYSPQCFAVNVQITNSCGTTSRGISICAQNCFSRYTVSPNPSKDYVAVEFEEVDNADALPDQIDLLSEKSTVPVRTVNVQETASRSSFKNGNSVEINVADLPRGTYYLHIKNSRREDKQVDIIRLLLE